MNYFAFSFHTKSLKSLCILYSCACVKSLQSCPTLCDPVDSIPTSLLCPWESPSKNTGVSCHVLLQGIFPTKELNLHLWATWEAHFILISSVQISCSVVSDSLRPHGLQHARLPCPSPTPGAYSNSCPLSQWCHSTISSSVIPFSSLLQSFPASGSFPMSQLFASRDQSVGVSASAPVLPTNIQDWFPLGWAGWISLQSKGLSRVFSNATVQKHGASEFGFRISSTQ